MKRVFISENLHSSMMKVFSTGKYFPDPIPMSEDQVRSILKDWDNEVVCAVRNTALANSLSKNLGINIQANAKSWVDLNPGDQLILVTPVNETILSHPAEAEQNADIPVTYVVYKVQEKRGRVVGYC